MGTEGAGAFRELVRHTLVYGSGYVTMAIASFVLVPVYTHHMSPSAYGLLGLMLVLYGLMSQVYDLGFTNSVGRFYFDGEEGDRGAALARMRATSLLFLVSFGGLLTAILVLFAAEWSTLLTQSNQHADLVRIVALTLYAEALALVPLTLIRMQERSLLFVAITLTRFVITLGLTMFFVISLGLGVRGALLGNAASAVAVLIVLAPQFGRRWKRPSWPLLREMLRFGLPFFPVILSGWFIEASDRYLLGLYRSQHEVGLYVLGYKVAQIMQIGVAAFSMGWAPMRYKIFERPSASRIYRDLATYYVLASSLLTVAIALFGSEIIEVIAPSSYMGAARIVPEIVAAYALNGLYILMVTGMGVAKKTGAMLWVVGAAAVVNVGVNLVAIPIWGMEAAAVTTVVANAMMVVGGWYYSQKVYPIPYDWRRILQTMAIGVAVVGVTLAVAPQRGIPGLATAVIAFGVYLLALRVTATVSGEELAAGRAWLGTWSERISRRRPGQEVAG